MRSSRMATIMDVTMEISSTIEKARTGLACTKPASAMACAAKTAVKAPAMNTSPWAKLIMNRMPYTSV